jgi:hypothetical protein
MNHGALVNLFLGGLVALVPLITRISREAGQEFHHEVLIFWVMVAFLGLPIEKLRKAPKIAYASCLLVFFAAYWNQHEPKSIGVFLHGSWPILASFFCVKLYEVYDARSKDYLFNVIAAGAIIQSTLCVIEVFGLTWTEIVAWVMGWTWKNSVGWNVNKEAVGSLGGNNWTGVYITLTSMFLLRRKWVLVLPLCVWALYLVGAIMAIAGFIAGIAIYIWNKHGFKTPAFLPYALAPMGFMALAYSGLIDEAQNGRFQAWKVMIEHFNAWVFGNGPGWFFDTFWAYYKVEGGHFRQEHNEFLAVLFGYGIVGIIFSWIWYVAAASSNGNAIFKSVLLAAFVTFFGYFTMHQATAAIVVLIAFAGVFVEEKHGKALAG